MKVIKHYSTIGLNTKVQNAIKQVRIHFDIREDDSVLVYAVSARNLKEMPMLGSKIITREHLSNLPDDPYNDVIFAEAAFGLLGLSIN